VRCSEVVRFDVETLGFFLSLETLVLERFAGAGRRLRRPVLCWHCADAAMGPVYGPELTPVADRDYGQWVASAKYAS
jgi:hypothetical protein